MLTEQSLVSGEELATDDMDGVNNLIKVLQNEIMKKHTRSFQLHREKKSEQAIELQDMAKEMQKEVDAMMNSQMKYMKFLKAIGQENKRGNSGVSQQLRDQKSSLGAIVSIVPKK